MGVFSLLSEPENSYMLYIHNSFLGHCLILILLLLLLLLLILCTVVTVTVRSVIGGPGKKPEKLPGP